MFIVPVHCAGGWNCILMFRIKKTKKDNKYSTFYLDPQIATYDRYPHIVTKRLY